MDYLEERSRHVKSYAIYLVQVLQNQEKLLGKVRRQKVQNEAFAKSPEISGLRALLAMSLYLGDDKIRNEPHNTRGEMVSTTSLQEDVQLLVLLNLLAPSRESLRAFTEKTNQVRKDVYFGLQGLKSELKYLACQLEKIPS